MLSWWLLHLFSEVGIEIIQIGYYVWAISIGLFTFIVWKEKIGITSPALIGNCPKGHL